MPTARVLIADNDPSAREGLAHHVRSEGFEPLAVADGMAALRAARTWADIIVLETRLPGIEGLEITRTLRREKHAVPIIIVSARTDEIDRVVGLEIGADDYLCKPFSNRELVARLRAILRRAGVECDAPLPRLTFGRLEIDAAAREARIDGIDVGLKPREFSLLLALATNPGVALSRRTLLERVWGFDFDGDERTVDVHVRRVRIKIQERPALPAHLLTVHGFGYKFARV